MGRMDARSTEGEKTMTLGEKKKKVETSHYGRMGHIKRKLFVGRGRDLQVKKEEWAGKRVKKEKTQGNEKLELGRPVTDNKKRRKELKGKHPQRKKRKECKKKKRTQKRSKRIRQPKRPLTPRYAAITSAGRTLKKKGGGTG